MEISVGFMSDIITVEKIWNVHTGGQYDTLFVYKNMKLSGPLTRRENLVLLDHNTSIKCTTDLGAIELINRIIKVLA